MAVLLLHPPAIKPSGPPLGLAILLGHLRNQGVDASALDANLDAYLYLLDPQRLIAHAGPEPKTVLRRALKNAPQALSLLKSPAITSSFARYQTAVQHLNTALSVYQGDRQEERLTLGDYNHSRLSEFSPDHLAALAAGDESTLFSNYFRDHLLPTVAARSPRLIALSINYRHQVLPAFELAGMLRRLLPEVTLAAGGGMLTSWKTALLERGFPLPPFDYVVFGPGEAALSELALKGSDSPYFLEQSTKLGFCPDFSGLDPAGYLNPHPVLPVTASRGCYWERCLFCPEAVAPTHPFAASAPAAFPDLLLHLAARWQTRYFHFTDNALPIPLLRALAARQADLQGFSWYGFARFEPELQEKVLAAGLAKAGCRLLQLGLESGSQRVLDRLGKGTRVEAASAILHNLHRAGIATYVYIMLGTPGETEEDRHQTLTFLEKHAETIGFLNLAIMNLPRGSILTGSDVLSDAEPFGLYRPVDDEGDQRRAARRFLKQELLSSSLVRAIVQRTPPLFTSDHAFFFPGP